MIRTALAQHIPRAGITLPSRMATIAGFGNPLMDITIKIDNDDLLRKYNLKMDDQSQIPKDEMRSLREDINEFPATRTLGGVAQNALRVFQWLTRNENHRTYIIGAIGNDKDGEYIKKLVTADGVTPLYSVSEKEPTGTTIALVHNISRCLVAHVGAAETFTLHDLQQVTKNSKLIESADLFYIEGFFLTERYEVTTYLVQYARTKKKLFMFNLSGPYICYQHPKLVKYIIDNCDILIGNKMEFKALTDVYESDFSPVDLALKLNRSYNGKNNFKYGKIILMTDGPNPIICIHGDNQNNVISIEKMPVEEIKDTTGAGDAFVAGFMAGLLRNYDLEKCVQYGAWSARQIIQQVGCKIPDYSPDFK